MRKFKDNKVVEKLDVLRALVQGSFPAHAFLHLTFDLCEHGQTLAGPRTVFNGLQSVIPYKSAFILSLEAPLEPGTCPPKTALDHIASCGQYCLVHSWEAFSIWRAPTFGVCVKMCACGYECIVEENTASTVLKHVHCPGSATVPVIRTVGISSSTTHFSNTGLVLKFLDI